VVPVKPWDEQETHHDVNDHDRAERGLPSKAREEYGDDNGREDKSRRSHKERDPEGESRPKASHPFFPPAEQDPCSEQDEEREWEFRRHETRVRDLVGKKDEDQKSQSTGELGRKDLARDQICQPNRSDTERCRHYSVGQKGISRDDIDPGEQDWVPGRVRGRDKPPKPEALALCDRDPDIVVLREVADRARGESDDPCEPNETRYSNSSRHEGTRQDELPEPGAKTEGPALMRIVLGDDLAFEIDRHIDSTPPFCGRDQARLGLG